MADLLELPKDFTPKKFWERPEGMPGMIVLALMIIGGGALLFAALPFIITLLQNTLYAAGLAIALAALVYIVSDKRFRTLVSYGFKSLMRKITSIYKTIDPIGILNNYIDDLEDDLVSMDKQIQNLKGQMRRLGNAITSNEENRKQNLQLAGRAHKEGKQAQFVLSARKAGRLEKSNLTLQQLYDKMELLYRALRKMYEVASFVLEDLKDEVGVKTREYEMIRAGYSAFTKAMNILKGQSDKHDLFMETMEYLTEDYGQKLGEIEHFVEVSKTFIDSVDLENGVYEENALKMLQEWEEEGYSILIGPAEKKLLLDFSSDPKNVVDFEEPLPKREEVAVEVKKKKDEKRKYEAFFEN